MQQGIRKNIDGGRQLDLRVLQLCPSTSAFPKHKVAACKTPTGKHLCILRAQIFKYSSGLNAVYIYFNDPNFYI